MLTTVLIAVLLFVVLGGLGFAFAGGDSMQTKTLKRAQSIAGGGAVAARARARVASSSPAIRREQILKTLKEQEKRQKQASLTLRARIQQAGLETTPKTFWIVSAVM